jgi:phage gpG-like protein
MAKWGQIQASSNLGDLNKWLGGMARRMNTRTEFYERAGKKARDEMVPKAFASTGPGWPPRRALRLGGGPLLDDTGKLKRSIRYTANRSELVVGTALLSPRNGGAYPATHQQGMVIKARDKFTNLPGGPYMSIPLSPPLSQSERQRPLSSFSDTFIRRSKSNPANFVIWQRKGSSIRPIFLLKNKVRIPQRQFLKWTPDYLEDVSDMFLRYIGTGQW